MATKVTMSTQLVPGPMAPAKIIDRWVRPSDYVRVGLPDTPHANTNLTVAQLGAIHEYGAPGANIPERPFLFSAIREGMPELMRLQSRLAFEIQNGTTSKTDALTKIGLFGQRLIQQKIRNGPFVPLKPATILRKGSSRPLIDTGQMIQSVTFELES